MFHQGFQTQENRCAFIVFECLETPMKHEAQVFEIASQSKLKLRSRKRNKIVKIYANYDQIYKPPSQL